MKRNKPQNYENLPYMVIAINKKHYIWNGYQILVTIYYVAGNLANLPNSFFLL